MCGDPAVHSNPCIRVDPGKENPDHTQSAGVFGNMHFEPAAAANRVDVIYAHFSFIAYLV
jgi:hypothetical protein